ncbi:MAG: hypothetical protein ABJB69_05950 [Spartobacteria bacterium]
MNENLAAEENLGTIRGLFERATIYRGIAARVALVGGTLSILTASAIFVNDEVTRFLDRPVRPREFAFAWLDILLLTVILSALFLWRAARDNADVFGSVRMKLALRVIAPSVLIPAAFTGWFFGSGYLGAAELDVVAVWIAFYGLLLLSTAIFAPRSIATLGWAFLLTGLAVPLLADKIDNWTGSAPTVLMGVTFGVYHLVFAALNWRRIAETKTNSSTDFTD